MNNIIGVLASGRGSNFQSIIEHISSNELDANIGVFISDNKNANAVNIAKKNNIPVKIILRDAYKTKIDFEKEIVDTLNKYNVALVVLAGYMRIVGETVLNNFKMRIINIHPSLLPSFPGLHAQQQALDYGVRYAGCTVHFVTKDVDCGPIILQSVVELKKDDTEETLAARILEEEHKILPQAIKLFLENKLEIIGRGVLIKDKV
jgi:phosphoribosylglycinamide formyltransferase-1